MDGREQAGRLAALGASAAEVEELLAYGENPFDLETVERGMSLPPPDEPFVEIWAGWAEEGRRRGAFAVLREHLPQLRFPIGKGISATEAYRAATRRGEPVDGFPEASGLALERPERLELFLHASPAGRIPVLVSRWRPDFVALVRALGRRNEPSPVPGSQGALMISGYNDWARIAGLRRRWEAEGPAERETATWAEEFARVVPRRELYQDRFILLSDGPYSGVPAADLGLGEAEWDEISLRIRLDHECAHYFTRRLLGAMRNNALDELIADYAGLVAAVHRFRADWFLRFLRDRLEIYRGDPPLSDGAFRVLGRLLADAAANVERFDATLPGDGSRTLHDRAAALATLASFRLEEIAAPGAEERLAARFRELAAKSPGPHPT
jgi:hypothetical protein